jgi:hypothetical protein
MSTLRRLMPGRFFDFGPIRGRIEILTGEELNHFLWHFRELGIHAIMEMNGLIGAIETPESAAAQWDRMDWGERHKLMGAYALMYAAGDHVIVDPRVKEVRWN